MTTSDGRTYYWNAHTDATSWTLPERDMSVLHACNEQIEDMVRIEQCAGVDRCLTHARATSLSIFFNAWARFAVRIKPRVVRSVVDALDHVFDLRAASRAMRAELEKLESLLVEECACNRILVDRLKESSVRAATSEFARLQSRARSSAM